MEKRPLETWDVWFPKAGATGISFARCLIDPTLVLLVHAAPPELTVQIWDGAARLLAEGKGLEATISSPITRLTRQGSQVIREDIWPGPDDLEQIVLLPGGEAGRLKSWWHAPDQSEWRWQVEFYNHL